MAKVTIAKEPEPPIPYILINISSVEANHI